MARQKGKQYQEIKSEMKPIPVLRAGFVELFYIQRITAMTR